MASIVWTAHAEWKMKQYGLSKQRVNRVIRHPRRTEEAILEGMIAAMQPSTEKMTPRGAKWKEEIWVMYALKNSRPKNTSRVHGLRVGKSKELRIISCWRYPGESPERDPIPADILRELASLT